MYLMFRPNPPESIFVPLKMAAWWWQGSAFFDGNMWVIGVDPPPYDNDDPTPDVKRELRTVDEPEYPGWVNNVNQLLWR